MRRLFFLSFLLFFISCVFPSRTVYSQSTAPSQKTLLFIDPNPSTQLVQTRLTAICSKAEGFVLIKWTRDDGNTGNRSEQLITTTYTVDVQFDEGTYNVSAICNDSESDMKTLVVKAAETSTLLSISPNPSTADNTQTTFWATCPADGQLISFHWTRKEDKNSAYYDAPYNATSNKAGMIMRFDRGTYEVKAKCNDVESGQQILVVNAASQKQTKNGLTFSTNTAPLTAGDPQSELIVEGCDERTKVVFEWARNSPGTGFRNATGQVSSNEAGRAAYSQPQGFAADTYRANVTCNKNGVSTKIDNLVFDVVAIPDSQITLTQYPEVFLANDPNSELRVAGCPPNGQIRLEWNLEEGDTLDGIDRNDGEDLTADTTGKATYKQSHGFNPGTYRAFVECGGTKKENLTFTVSTQKPTPTAIITPPGPPCIEGVDGNGNITTDPNFIIKCTKVRTGIGEIDTNVAGFIQRIYRLLLGIAGGVGVFLIIYAGYKYIISRGDPEGIKGAKEMLVSTIVGLLFLIFSFVILEIIGVDILQLPGFGR
jgi:hypothetical protein